MNAIVYISNLNDMRFLVSSLTSLRYFNKQIKVFILSDMIPSDENKRQLHEFRVEVITCKELFYAIFPNISKYSIKRWSNLVFYKLLMPVIPQLVKYDRILYVDTDTLFVKDFDFLMNFPMKCMYGMFYEQYHCEKYGNWLREKLQNAYDFIKKHGYAPVYALPAYYNAGVILFDIKTLVQNTSNWQNAICLFDKVFDNDIFVHNEQMFLNMFFDFDKFRSKLWDANSKTITDKTVIAHYYSANLKQKRQGYINALLDILRRNKQLYDNVTARIFR